MTSEEITSEDFWKGFWKIGEKDIKIAVANELPFSPLLKKFIKKSKNGTAIEIGCFPGIILSYLCKTFNYFPEGIDYLDETEEVFEKTLQKSGLEKYKYHNSDFLKWKSPKQYDLVCSFGFIEHFKNPDEVLEKHVKLLKKGGTLLVNVPNFNGLRYFISNLTDKDTLLQHNLTVMNKKFFLDFAKKNNLEIKFLDFYGRFEYTWCNKNPTILQKFIYYPFKILSKILMGYPFKNKFLSGWLFFIAEKK